MLTFTDTNNKSCLSVSLELTPPLQGAAHGQVTIKDAGDVERTFFWPIIIQRTKVFLEAYAIPSKKTQRKMGVHVLVSMVTEQIY